MCRPLCRRFDAARLDDTAEMKEESAAKARESAERRTEEPGKNSGNSNPTEMRKDETVDLKEDRRETLDSSEAPQSNGAFDFDKCGDMDVFLSEEEEFHGKSSQGFDGPAQGGYSAMQQAMSDYRNADYSQQLLSCARETNQSNDFAACQPQEFSAHQAQEFSHQSQEFSVYQSGDFAGRTHQSGGFVSGDGFQTHQSDGGFAGGRSRSVSDTGTLVSLEMESPLSLNSSAMSVNSNPDLGCVPSGGGKQPPYADCTPYPKCAAAQSMSSSPSCSYMGTTAPTDQLTSPQNNFHLVGGGQTNGYGGWSTEGGVGGFPPLADAKAFKMPSGQQQDDSRFSYGGATLQLGGVWSPQQQVFKRDTGGCRASGRPGDLD